MSLLLLYALKLLSSHYCVEISFVLVPCFVCIWVCDWLVRIMPYQASIITFAFNWNSIWIEFPILSIFGCARAWHFALCVARALNGAAGGGRQVGWLSFDLRGLRGNMHPSSQKNMKTCVWKKFSKLFYALMCRILCLNFCTYCAPPVLSLFGPASPCWLKPTPDA